MRRLQGPIPPNSIQWEFCNILEADPQRRLRLISATNCLKKCIPPTWRISSRSLSPEDREAIFENIDSEVAAETLSEVEPDIQASILESLDTETAADIVEEMSPAEAADALNELEEQTSYDILEEMEAEPKTEVRELLGYPEDTAGGMMNTEYVALPEDATVADAMAAIKSSEEVLEKLNTFFLVDSAERLKAAVPLARLFLASGATPLKELAAEDLIHVDVEEKENNLTEIFDKYNLLALPVVDHGWETGRRDHRGRHYFRPQAQVTDFSMPKRLRTQAAIFLSVLGPGLITANVDNDAGGIYTYSAAGAKYGYLPLWTLIPITLLLIVTQEMCSRMGAVTGKGLSDLIREEFGLRTTFFMMAALVIANFTNVVAEFAGIATCLQLFHISPYVSVPLSAAAVWLLVVRGSYRTVEKVFLLACTLYITYIISGVLVKPDWKEAAIYSVQPHPDVR